MQGLLDVNFSQNKSCMCFIRSRENHLSRYYAIISYFSRLPSRKIETFPLPWMYLIPFPAILKPNFPISCLKRWQIPRPEKALLGPLSRRDRHTYQRDISYTYLERRDKHVYQKRGHVFIEGEWQTRYHVVIGWWANKFTR